MNRPLNVLLGVSGGIAAVKVPEIIRRLRERGHNVRCALTRNGGAFVSPLSLEVLCEHQVYREEYLRGDIGGEELHISLARWSEVVCIVPATCNTIARLSLGLADDFLSTTILAFEGQIVMAPAMSMEMWSKPIVQLHMSTLKDRGVRLVGPVSGRLASGEIGMGRMAEPEEIVATIESTHRSKDLVGKTVLITAGPTREALDPVRFMSNRSSGKMGFHLAAVAAQRGARTLLVAGPVDLATPIGVERIDVESALEMSEIVSSLAPDADLIIMTAAVADFRPTRVSSEKLKKSAGAPTIRLVSNPDILTGLAVIAENSVRVGFAAETANFESEARRKLDAKHVHFIVANDVSRPGIGFDSEENEVTVFDRNGLVTPLAKKHKKLLAGELLDIFAESLKKSEADVIIGN